MMRTSNTRRGVRLHGTVFVARNAASREVLGTYVHGYLAGHKDDATPSMERWLAELRDRAGADVRIEVETSTLDDLREPEDAPDRHDDEARGHYEKGPGLGHVPRS